MWIIYMQDVTKYTCIQKLLKNLIPIFPRDQSGSYLVTAVYQNRKQQEKYSVNVRQRSYCAVQHC